MGYDLFQSRRNYNERCAWWGRDERDEEYTDEELEAALVSNADELIMKRVPSGYFMAKQENPESKRENTIYNIYMTEKTTVTLKTPDDVTGIKNKDIVLYRGEKWFVVSVQKILARIQQSEYATDHNCSHYWYIELRK